MPADAGEAVAYVDQSASGLALTVLEGAVDMGQFTILRADTLNVSGIKIRAAIIGASHVLSFETPERTLTEVFACTGERSSPNQRFFGPLEHLLGGETRLTVPGGITYGFRTFFGDSADVERLKRKLANGPREIGMMVGFPPISPDQAPPETVVSVRHTGTRVLVETAHCYHTEGRMVITASELAWRRDT